MWQVPGSASATCSINIYFSVHYLENFRENNYWFKVNKRKNRTRCEICSNLTIKTPERPCWRRSGVFIVNFEHIYTFFY